jgi:predicted patatin/cPLA2 family phospholipase
MSCSYGQGVLSVLRKHYGLKSPHVVIGSSGSAANAAYYVADQTDDAERIWLEKTTQPEFIRPKKGGFGKIIDIDLLVDGFIKDQVRLEIEKVLASPSELLITATELQTAATKHFSNRSIGNNLYEALRASKAIPGAYGKAVEIDGIKYIDGDLSTSLVDNIRQAVEMGCGTVIAVNNNNGYLNAEKAGILANCFTNLQAMRAIGKRLRKKVFQKKENHNGTNVIVVKPGSRLPTSTLNNSPEAVSKSLRQGTTEAMEHQGLESFFNARSKGQSIHA